LGLENLKSIFSGDIGVNKSIHSGRHNKPDESYEQHGIIASQLNIDGTTPIFQTPFELGYGDYAGYATDKPGEVNPFSFNFGVNWTAGSGILPNITLQTSGNGIQTSLNYINNITGQTLSIGGMVNSALGSIGLGGLINTGPTKYSDTIWELGSYGGSVVGAQGPLSSGEIFVSSDMPNVPVPYRGIVFEVADKQNLDKKGRLEFIQRRAEPNA